MVTAYSTAWKKSKNPSKQRKLQMNAPMHQKRKFMAAHLSKDLQKTQKVRSSVVRIGDKVKILRGGFKGRSAKIERIDLSKSKIYLTGIDQEKREGGRALYPVHPSNVMIEELNTSDKQRFKHPRAEKTETKKVEKKSVKKKTSQSKPKKE